MKNEHQLLDDTKGTQTKESVTLSDTVNCLVSLPDWLIAKAICEACGENVYHNGDASGNDYRWED